MTLIKDILQAQKVISGKIKKTPLILSEDISKKTKADIYFKPECLQITGSFKIRGVLNSLYHLDSKKKKKGIITLSAGDHALSLTFAASKLKIPIVAVIPKDTPKNKIKKIRRYGAKLILSDGDIQSECEKIQHKHKLTMIHPFDDLLVIAGQGTIGLEIIDELPQVDAVFVPVGGGGLIAGIATAIKSKRPQTKIIGVEPANAPTMSKSMSQKKIIYLRRKERETIAEALSSPYVGKNTLKYAQKYVDELVLVSDKEIINALRTIWKTHKIKVEPSGATAFAAILYKKTKLPPKSKVVCILSGGNIDKERFEKLLTNKNL